MVTVQSKLDYTYTQTAVSEKILHSAQPIELLPNDTEEIEVHGQRGVWVNRAEVANWRNELPIECYPINQDPSPEYLFKCTNQQVAYNQEIAIRYLRPPTPPVSGEILILQEPNCQPPPAPPLIMRQQPARPCTPPPLVIRECPPPTPPTLCPKLITIAGKRLPPPPRKVIIERLPVVPPKPRSILIERWLPYQQPRRRVVFQRCAETTEPVVSKPKNVIVQWDAPKVVVNKEVRNLGVIKADPVKYKKLYSASLTSPDKMPDFVKEMPVPPGIKLAIDESKKNASLPELYGDLDALNLIDLEKEGLSAYKNFLRSNNSTKSRSRLANARFGSLRRAPPPVPVQAFDVNRMSPNEMSFIKAYFTYRVCQITCKDMRMTFDELNRIFCKTYSESDAWQFFQKLDADGDGFVDFQDFKRVFVNLF
jgi:hypothetical protein